MEPVVVGVDGTLASMRALDLAADEAMGRVVPLVVVYTVAPPLDPTLPQHQRLLDLAVSRAEADHPGLAVSAELVRGEPVEALIAWSWRACLLVLGHAHGDHPSVAAGVVERSAAPVIVYRPFVGASQVDRRPVLVGVDATGPGLAALRFAFEEAALRGAPLSVVQVWPGPAADEPGVTGAASPAQAARLLSAAIAQWSSRYAEVPVHSEVLRGRAVASALAGASRNAALVVVGAHHDGAAGSSGPVSRALIDLAACPVAVVDAVRVPAALAA